MPNALDPDPDKVDSATVMIKAKRESLILKNPDLDAKSSGSGFGLSGFRNSNVKSKEKDWSSKTRIWMPNPLDLD
jgi:hypothetical protein